MRLQFGLQMSVLNILLATNLILFLIANLFNYFFNLGSPADAVGLLGGYDFFKIFTGQVWLLITSGFLHFDLFHFLINMYSLFRVGQIVSNFYSDKILFTVYVLGALGGSLLTFIVSIAEISLFNSVSSPFSVGASSGIFALIGLLLGGTLRRSRYGFQLPFSFTDVLPLVLFSLLIGLIPGTNINNWAHLGGLITGVILGIFVPHAMAVNVQRRDSLENALFIGSNLIFLVSFFALIANFLLLIFRN